jgi:glycosyltransferase involved in cell wall biosynthesis
MNIAIISPWAITPAAVGGTERFCMDLGEGLLARKHNVTIFMLSGKSHKTNGVTYNSLQLLGDESVATEYDLRRLLGDFSDPTSFDKLAEYVQTKIDGTNFDVIHINSLLLVRAWQQCKRIFTIHTNPYEYILDWGELGYKQTIKLLAQEANNPFTRLTAPSSHYADLFTKETGANVAFIPHALDVSRISTNEPSRALRKKYELHPSKTILLLPSRLEVTQKRPQIAFGAAAQLPVARKESMQIVATGLDEQYTPFRNQLQKIADEAHLEAHFLRFDTMAEAYALSDIVGLPSCSESFGYSALESLALQKPTILNNIPTYHEIGSGNPNAYFFNNTVEAFGEELERVLAAGCAKRPVPSAWSNRYGMQRWIAQYEAALKI